MTSPSAQVRQDKAMWAAQGHSAGADDLDVVIDDVPIARNRFLLSIRIV